MISRCHNLPSSSPAVVSSRHPPIVVLFTIRFCSSNNEVNNLVVIAIREVVGTKMENFHDYIGILQGLQHPAFWLATCDMKFLLMYAWLMYHLQVTHQLPLRITGPLWRESRSNQTDLSLVSNLYLRKRISQSSWFDYVKQNFLSYPLFISTQP